jgi:hypothetical protein
MKYTRREGSEGGGNEVRGEKKKKWGEGNVVLEKKRKKRWRK